MENAPSLWKKQTILFLVSQGVTLFGSSLVQFAIVWYVTRSTGSGAWVSALTVFSFLPQMLISLPAGVWADRYSKKLLIVLSDGIIALSTLILALLLPRIGEGGGLLTALLFVSLVRSLGAGVQLPAVNAVIPLLVPEERLMKFNGVNATVQSVVQFAAPAAAGAILTLGTLKSTLYIDVLTAVVGISLFLLIPLPALKRAEAGAHLSVFSDFKAGLSYAFSDPFLGKLLLLYGLFIFLCVPAGFLATLFVTRTYGNSYLYMTLVELIGFLGMAAGGFLMGTWGGFSNRVKTLCTGLVAFGALAVGMGAVKSFPFYLSMMLLYGIALTMVQTSVTTLTQEKTDPAMQGRVFGLMGSIYSGFLPIGMALFGPLSDAVPLSFIMILSGALLLLLAFIWRALPGFYASGEGKLSATPPCDTRP